MEVLKNGCTKIICGINNSPDSAGFKKAIINPHTDIRLKYAQCMLNTAAGIYKSSWSFNHNKKITYKIEIPFNAEAKVNLPEGVYIVNGNKEVKFPCILLTGKYKIEEREDNNERNII